MVSYPTCLVYLGLIQQELFRSRLGDIGFVQELSRIGTRHHETWCVSAPLRLAGLVGLTGRRVEKAPVPDKAEKEEKPNGVALA